MSFNADSFLAKVDGIIRQSETLQVSGKVIQVVGLIIESEGPLAAIGEVCRVMDRDGRELCRSEVVGFRNDRILSMILGELREISPGTKIVATGKSLEVGVGNDLLGRILDGLGRPIDGKGPVRFSERRSIYSEPPNPFQRRRISEQVATGIRAIDSFLAIGKGQRIGIFSGSGVGKSTTLGMMARNSAADVNVIGLVGERGRELRDFVEKELGEEGLSRSVIVVATSDQPALARIKAAFIATTIAEYFRDQHLDVLLMLDSVTRFAMAQREVGLAIGEPPTTKGYTPSVFAMLPKLMERAGTSERGTITGFYTVLVEGDDMNEPIADATRGILDGHVVLSRKLAAKAHYPAIDILESVSRVMPDIVSGEHYTAIRELQDIMATYYDAEDLISVGAYQKNSNPRIDRAIAMIDRITAFLKQGIDETALLQDTLARLGQLLR